MAVEEINAQGGILGKKVRMIVEDTETDPAAGARKAQKLIERDKVHFMLGAVSSSVAIAVSEVAQRATSTALLGGIAVKLQRKLRWDPDKERFPDDPDANRLLTCAMRPPWRL